MKILIVDDEFVSRKKAQKILSQYGRCDIAINGNEALHAIHLAREEGSPYDLVTMDILMPDMNGLEALKKIREKEASNNIRIGHGVKVLMLTAQKTPDLVLASFDEGCEAYVVKPFNKQDLSQAMVKLGLIADET